MTRVRLGKRSRESLEQACATPPRAVTIRLLTAAGTIRTRHETADALGTAEERIEAAKDAGLLSLVEDRRIGPTGVRVRDDKGGHTLTREEIKRQLVECGFCFCPRLNVFYKL